MKIYTNELLKGHSDFKVKCLTFGLYTQVSDSGPLGPLVCMNFKNFPLNSIKFSNIFPTEIVMSFSIDSVA